jgi:hypothetical protein
MLEKENNYESENCCRIALHDNICIFFGLYGEVIQIGESRRKQRSISIVLSLNPEWTPNDFSDAEGPCFALSVVNSDREVRKIIEN